MSGLIVPIGQNIYFDAITSSSSGAVFDADSLPTWEVFEEENDVAILSGNFTKRAGHVGNYRAKFEITDTAGFVVGIFYSVIGTAIVNGVQGKCVCLIFRVGPVEASTGVPNVNVFSIDLIPALYIADNILDRDMAAGVDSGTQNIRTVRQALRFLRNRWYIFGGVLYVLKEDDDEESWNATLSTDAAAQPITGIDPAGGV